MPKPRDEKRALSDRRSALPISAPSRASRKAPKKGAPDLHIEEIEDRHIPKDRNVFDK